MRSALGIAAVFALTACGSEPRSATYFAAHPDEARTVLARCKTGQHRGAECANASAAETALKADERMATLKKGF